MNEKSDEALIADVRAGDADALAAFIERRRPQLTAFIARQMSDALRRKVEPDDLVQEVSVACVRAVGDVDLTDRDPFGWLCQMAERRIIDAHRHHFAAQKRSAEREVSLGAAGGDSKQAGLIDLLVASMTTASAAFSRDQRQLKLLAALDQLPEQSREALRLRYVEGLPSKEIAERLGKSDGACRVLLTRSLKKLQELLGPDAAPR
ncbi:MAG: sigma-70 family RNA polymerase sigma factor [Planctomycetales bacterium]|nr:sigma-70 family RNA polymerase sigma factor [Planctomycetales bacterium]